MGSADRTPIARRAQADTLNTQGNALRERHRLDEALASYDAALALIPDLAAGLYNRANVLLELGRTEDALAGFDRVLTLAPEDVESLTLRGNALAHLKRLPEALASYDGAVAIAPDYVPALYGSGNALLGLGRAHEALARYDRAIAIAPDHTGALCNRGNILLGLRRFEAALASYERALAFEPDSAGASMNRGNVLLEMGRPEDALASYDRALAIDSHFADALGNRGSVLQQLKRYDEAAQSFSQLLVTAPGHDYALGNLLDCRLRNCEWGEYAGLTSRLLSEVQRGARAATPFVFLAAPGSSADQLQCARTYAEDRYPAHASRRWTGQRHRHERIRIAYLSADFRDHAVAHSMAAVFEMHDRRRFETIAISLGHDVDDPMRRRLRPAFDHFLDVRTKSDGEVAELLRALETDIAIDLMGYTTDCRPGILAHRPAPLQVNYLGFAGTMGATHIDYILADRIVIPETARADYAESVVYLPDTFFPAGSTEASNSPPPSRAEAGLPPRGFVFCSLNNSYKITPNLFEIWMRLLRRVDGSVLWLPAGTAAMQANLRREAATLGVSPERLVFAAWGSFADYHARFQLADLFLDTSPYNAHSTASDALRAGLPLLTLLGTTFAGRVAASLLHAIGLPELVATSLDEYEKLAMKLATDGGLLQRTTEKLRRARASAPLFDSDRFRRHLEGGFLGMWERWQRGDPPVSFGVAPCS